MTTERRVAASVGDITLVTYPNVQLLEVGENWVTSTGIFTFTVEHLQSAIASQADPMVRTPIIKLGHTDPRFDGQPSCGRICNLRLENNIQTLVGDYVGLPAWLAECMASAFPRRSIEGSFDIGTRTGNTWPFVLTALALLGDAYPAINSLDDIQAFFGKDPVVLIPAADNDQVVASDGESIVLHPLHDSHLIRAADGDPGESETPPPGRQYNNPPTLQIAAATGDGSGTSVNDVANAFYDGPGAEPGRYWWWIREMRVDPAELIVDDDEGNLFRLSYTVASDGSITFGEPQQVRIQYVDVAATGQRILQRFGSPVAAGRPRARQTVRSSQPDQEVDVQLSAEILQRLGLGPEATEDEINAALATRLTEETTPASAPETPAPPTGSTETPPASEATPPASEATPPPAPTPLQVPDGMVLVDEATMAEMREGVAAARRIEAQSVENGRKATLDAAIKAGKFPPARREHYEALLKADPEGTRQLIDALAENVIPVAERGTGGEGTGAETQAAAGYPETWKPMVAAARRGAGSRVKVATD